MKPAPPLALRPITPRVLCSAPDEACDRPVMGAVLGGRSTLVVEAGASPAHAREFQVALEAQDSAPVRFVALTHWHWDHVFGASAWDAPVLAHHEAYYRMLEMAQLDWRSRALEARVAAGAESRFIADHLQVEMSEAERARLVLPPPDLIFDDRVEVDLGELTARVIHVGGDHSPDSAVVFIPGEAVAFLGDCLYSAFTLDGRHFYTPGRLTRLLDALEELEAAYYVLGHDPDPLPRAAFLEEAAGMRAAARAAKLSQGDRQAALEALTQALGAQPGEPILDTLDLLLEGMKLS